MADIYFNSAAAGSNNGTSWTNAYTTFSTALAAAAANDTVWVAQSAVNLIAGTLTLTAAAGVRIISTADTTNMPPTTYDAQGSSTGSIGTSGSSQLSVNGGSWYGITFKAATSSNNAVINIGNVTGLDTYLQDCILQGVGTGASGKFVMGLGTVSYSGIIRTRNCQFIFANTGAGFNIGGDWADIGSNLDVGPTHPTMLFSACISPSMLNFNGSNLAANPNKYFLGNSAHWFEARLANCKLNASATIMDTVTGVGQGNVYLFDCASGDTEYNFAHYNYRGNTVVNSSIYLSAGATFDGSTHYSMAVTGVNVSRAAPYNSPWIDKRSDGSLASAITPSLQAARDGSATKYTDAEVWGEFLTKSTSGFPTTTLTSDGATPVAAGTAQDTGAGTGAWTGLSGTACSMVLAPASTVTPQEVGYMRARVAIAVAGTVYIDPTIAGF